MRLFFGIAWAFILLPWTMLAQDTTLKLPFDFTSPTMVTSDGTNLYVTDFGAGTIVRIVTATGETFAFAGSPGNQTELDDAGARAGFNKPFGIVSDGTNLYVSDFGGNTIRKVVIATGQVTTLAGSGTKTEADGTGNSASFYGLAGLIGDQTNLYVADDGGNTVRKLELTTGKVTTLAGSGKKGGQDGKRAEATFNIPKSLAINGSTLYIAEENRSAG